MEERIPGNKEVSINEIQEDDKNMRIREAQPGDAGPIARVHLDAWRTTYADFLPADFLAGLSYQDREATWVDILATHRPRTCNFVAETNEGEIVGFACGGPEEKGDQIYPGELYLVYLFQHYQRRGLGRLFIAAVAQRLLADGFKSMMLWVIRENHSARRFYELLGGEQLVGQKDIAIGETKLVEVPYGWKDTSELTIEQTP